MDKIPFEDGTLVKKGYVTIDGTEHEVEPAEYTGKIPLSAYNLIKMQDNIEEAIDEGDLVKRPIIEGNSKQDKREGYNKFLNTFVSTTSNGITLTMDKDKMHFEGTSTASTNFRISKKIPSELLGKTATLTVFGLENTTFANAGFKKTSTGANILIVNTVQNSTTVEITQEMIDAADIFDFFITSGKTVNADIYIQLVEGTEEKPYEPYGVSPSIDYPSEVKSVGDNINIFDKDNAEILHVWLNRTGTTISTISNNDTSIIVPVKPNETYTVSKKASGTTAKNRLVLGTTTKYPTYSTELNVVNGLVEGTTETKLSIKTGENDKYLIAYIYSKDTLTTEQEMLDSIKICKGTSTGAYSPYGQGSIEMSMDNGNSSDGELELGTIEGTTGNTTDNPARMRSKNFIEVDNTLKYTITSSENSNVKIFIFEYDKNKTYISRTSDSWLTMPYQYNPRSNTKYIKIVITYIDNTNIDITKDIELKIYDKFQSNILYTQQPFRAIGDVKDRFVKKNGVWYEEHNVSKFSLSKITDWVKSSSYSNDTYFCGYSQGGIPTFIDGAEMMCDKLPIGLYSNVTDKECINNAHQFQIRILASRLSENSTTGLSNYLAENPIYVYYVTTTPELIPCTPEQVEVLNDIYSAYGEGMTNIICNDEVEPAIEIIKETKETVQSNNDKAISALLERVSQLESIVSSMQTTTAEEGA